MDGLARLGGDAVEQGGEIGGIGVFRRLVARRAVANDAAALLGADDGEGGGFRMGAALGAARDVHGNAVAGKGHMARDLGGKRARRDQAMRAGGRARTGGDAAARIGGVRDEAKALRGTCVAAASACAERSEQKRAAWRRPHPSRAIGLGDPGKLA